MPEEIQALLEALEARSQEISSGVVIHRGRLEGKEVVLARSGVGKVNAAAVAQLLASAGPRALIFTGVAGAVDPSLSTGDLVVGVEALQHDVDVTALGYELGRVPGEALVWKAAPDLVEIALEAAARLAADSEEFGEVQILRGRVASGDQFVADTARTTHLREVFAATCVEMEGAAVAQVCNRAGVPFVIIRSISDSADGEAQMSFREFTELAAGRAKALVRAMLRRL